MIFTSIEQSSLSFSVLGTFVMIEIRAVIVHAESSQAGNKFCIESFSVSLGYDFDARIMRSIS